MNNEVMGIAEFQDVYELGSHMYHCSERHRMITCAVLFYDEVIKLAKMLMSDDGVKIASISIKPQDDYKREYYVTLDYDCSLYIEPVWREGECLKNDVDIMYFDGGANSSVSFANDCEKYEICIIDEEDDEEEYIEEDDCGECCADCSLCDKPTVVRRAFEIFFRM